MNFKLDENFGARTQRIFEQAGHDAETVRSESLQGASDKRIFEVCCAEGKCLVTLDLDFSDVTRFPPNQGGGIAVIRVPRNPSRALLEGLVRQLLETIKRMPLDKRLWIVEVGRVRVHQADLDEEL